MPGLFCNRFTIYYYYIIYIILFDWYLADGKPLQYRKELRVGYPMPLFGVVEEAMHRYYYCSVKNSESRDDRYRFLSD